MLGPGSEPDPAAVCKDMSERWPSLGDLTDPRVQRSASTMAFSFLVGELEVVVGRMPVPIPWRGHEFEEECERSWLWRTAAEDLKPQTAHLVVAVCGHGEHLDLVRLLTQTTASIFATSPNAIGVSWYDSNMMVSSRVFLKLAGLLPNLPLHLWINFRVVRNMEGGYAACTTGLAPLGHMEFETLNAPEEPAKIRERLYALAHYVLDHGPVIRDGDTIGETAEERMRIVYSESEFGQPGRVMQLIYPTARR
jgi:hypothetical protein